MNEILGLQKLDYGKRSTVIQGSKVSFICEIRKIGI